MEPIPIARPLMGAEEEAAVVEVLRSRWLTSGTKVGEFERAFADRVGAPHAIAVSSGTAALHLALIAAGIRPADDVVCPSLSFIATANSIVHAGARPIFADVDARTLNMTAETVAAAMTPRTRAVMVVHQVGLPADVDKIAEIAPNAIIIEDAACSVGAKLRGVCIGRPHGLLACFSFHPRKVMTTGEGGMVTTADGELAARLRRLRNHGGNGYDEVGWNYRMTDIQAAIGIVQLARLDVMLARRHEVAARYAHLLPEQVERPAEPHDRKHAFQSYVVRLRGVDRSWVMDALAKVGIETRLGVMTAHSQKVYAPLGARLPVTDALAHELLALPMYHELTEDDQKHVVTELAKLI
jgi:perosamine synthetase